ncbi:hypothetical protein LTS14_004374 [Recurvomyces mirabilis]|uniref:uncharacterized protein n=1 Tax=Recurvomyces mirabilis TaxID=574656 RepID=UPI002DDEAE11|nr:hypothetical protein LTS14_004374 [Recurvomyces mirabilis]
MVQDMIHQLINGLVNAPFPGSAAANNILPTMSGITEFADYGGMTSRPQKPVQITSTAIAMTSSTLPPTPIANEREAPSSIPGGLSRSSGYFSFPDWTALDTAEEKRKEDAKAERDATPASQQDEQHAEEDPE